jgi:hypothetical protein
MVGCHVFLYELLYMTISRKCGWCCKSRYFDVCMGKEGLGPSSFSMIYSAVPIRFLGSHRGLTPLSFPWGRVGEGENGDRESTKKLSGMRKRGYGETTHVQWG